MGVPGTGVVGEDGMAKLLSSGKAALFDAQGESCCCEPPPYPCNLPEIKGPEFWAEEFNDLHWDVDWGAHSTTRLEGSSIVVPVGEVFPDGNPVFGIPAEPHPDPLPASPKSRILTHVFSEITVTGDTYLGTSEEWSSHLRVMLARLGTGAIDGGLGFSFLKNTRAANQGYYFFAYMNFIGETSGQGPPLPYVYHTGQRYFNLPFKLKGEMHVTVDEQGRYLFSHYWFINGVLQVSIWADDPHLWVKPNTDDQYYSVDDPPCPLLTGMTIRTNQGYASGPSEFMLQSPKWGFRTSQGEATLAYDPAGVGTSHWNYNIGDSVVYSPIVYGLVEPFTYSIASGSRPFGTELDPSTGVVSGNPVSAGGGEISIRVLDSNGDEAVSPVYTWAGTIVDFPDPPDIDPLELSYPSPFTNSATAPTVPKDWRLEDGGATITPTASGGVEPYSYAATGLPPGCSILPAGGEVILSGGHNQVTTETGMCEITLTDDIGTPIVVSYDWERIGSGGP